MAQHLVHGQDETREGPFEGRWSSYENHRDITRIRSAPVSVRLAEPPARTIAFDGSPDLPTDREARLPLLRRLAPQHDEGRPLQALAPLEHRLELAGASEPLRARKRERPRR
jgi:hypothetical protein